MCVCGVIKKAFLLPLILLITLTIGTIFTAEEAHAKTLTVTKIASESDLPAETEHQLVYFYSVSASSSKVTYTIGDNYKNRVVLCYNTKDADTNNSGTFLRSLWTKEGIDYQSGFYIGSASDPVFTIYVKQAGYTSDGQTIDLKITINQIYLLQLNKSKSGQQVCLLQANNITIMA